MTRFVPSGPLRGWLRPPSDKSISHRAALIAAMGEGETEIRGFLDAADTRSTLAAVEAIGADVVVGVETTTVAVPPGWSGPPPDIRVAPSLGVRIRGAGLRGAGPAAIDVGNAGTLLRLLPGWLAGQEDGSWTLDGDESIRRRPVDRIAVPLREMGADLAAREERLPPLEVRGARLRGITYRPPIASAQVKSCLLFAGLLAAGETIVLEAHPTRDHTERMLAAAGAPIESAATAGAPIDPAAMAGAPTPPAADAGGPIESAAAAPPIESAAEVGASIDPASEAGAPIESAPEAGASTRPVGAAARAVTVRPAEGLEPGSIAVPGDVSSAAFFVVAATLLEGSDVVLEEVGVNPTRTGVLAILKRMGAVIEVEPTGERGGEPTGRLRVRPAPLHATEVGGAEVPLAIDELPLVALAACFAEGTTTIRDAADLRRKESDRIATVTAALTALGGRVEATDDGMAIEGTGGLRGGAIDSHGDHRIAMLGAVAGLASAAGVEVRGMEAAAVSYPGFEADLAFLLGRG